MPTPRSGETEDEFVKRCVPIVLDEGTAKDGSQAAAICHSLWANRSNTRLNAMYERWKRWPRRRDG